MKDIFLKYKLTTIFCSFILFFIISLIVSNFVLTETFYNVQNYKAHKVIIIKSPFKTIYKANLYPNRDFFSFTDVYHNVCFEREIKETDTLSLFLEKSSVFSMYCAFNAK